ncbi:hypothetical protein K6119_12995 [Paracrocinitomix mangrovi]|uniref:hypothetical protein n=1 Tax=Paracrocinitomix mangrovi TaxID=2862509 RepID=UPI001C8F0429|nr:hypothetical protein [Paracrocinitomix mangrovi]UKN00646.1 hypothetical protein K6119_12995 [Paracrocinitomix mangrovi]
MIKNFLAVFTIIFALNSSAQVFNYGHQDLAFKNLLKNGVCFMKTGDEKFDSTLLDAMEKYWTISEYTFVEQYKHPHKEMTAMFVTTKTKTKKHVMDRKNQHILCLQPAVMWKKDKQVPFDQTLGYMYYNGFFELLEEDEEYLFNRYIIKALNRGLTIIKEKRFHNNNQDLNEQIAEEIRNSSGNPVGNTLILNREFTVHFVDVSKLDKNNIDYRLFAKDEFFTAINSKKKTDYLLYYSVNTRTEFSLINIVSGDVIYTKHFPEGYTMIKPKEWKLVATFF